MFVFLSKFLPPFAYPLGLACVILLASLIFRKRQHWQTSFILAAFLLLFVGGNRFVSMGLSRSLEWQYLPQREIPNAPVIVVLGGGTDSAEQPRPLVELNSAGDRVLYGAQLYKEGKAANILLSGGSITWLGGRASTPAEEMRQIMEMLGVPKSAMWLQGKSQNTYEDALYSTDILKEKGIQKIILVTSAMHMPRSVALFRKQGIEVIPAPADFRVTNDSWNSLFEPDLANQVVSFWPSVGNLSGTSNALKEYLGIWVYRLRGWL
jgi:uncharacterized SAM-binding protein YcdF (DUF218 family)